jgi:PAS domain S-box-containing protein
MKEENTTPSVARIRVTDSGEIRTPLIYALARAGGPQTISSGRAVQNHSNPRRGASRAHCWGNLAPHKKARCRMSERRQHSAFVKRLRARRTKPGRGAAPSRKDTGGCRTKAGAGTANPGIETNMQRDTSHDAIELIQQMISGGKDGVVVYGRDLKCLVWNPTMEKLTGKSAVEVLGKRPLEVFAVLQANGVIKRVKRVLAGKTCADAELHLHLPYSGRPIWVSDTCSAIRNTKG